MRAKGLSQGQGPTPTLELCPADGAPKFREGKTRECILNSLSGGIPQGANPPQSPRGGWELTNSPHTGRPPLSAESLPFLGRLCWDGLIPLPQGHILTLKEERQPMGDCQHVNEPEKA